MSRNKKLLVLLLSVLTVFCLSFVLFAGCDSEEKKVTITASLSKSVAVVGDEITVSYSASDGSDVTVTYAKDGGAAVAFTGNKFEADAAGVYVFTFTAEKAEAVTKTLTVKTAQDALFADGKGTAAEPYEIATTEQFLNISAMKEAILSASEPYSFALTADIDLSDENMADVADQGSYFVEVFGGTLDGQNHKIICGNGAEYIFHYFYGDTAFKNITIDLGETSITRLVGVGAYKASGIREITSGDKIYQYFETDAESISLSYTNVDYAGKNAAIYFMGDNNASLYHNQNCTVMYAYYENEFHDTYNDTTYIKGTDKMLRFDIKLSDCDVNANFTGGYGASGAAVFLSGQIGEYTYVTFTNCSYTGTFKGLNVGVLFANSAWTKDYLKNVTVTNLAVDGDIMPFGTNSGVTFSNNLTEAQGVTDENKACVTVQQNDAVLAVSGAENEEYQITAAASADTAYYEVKLSLQSIYWYKDGTYSGDWYAQTNSNNMTFRVEKTATSETGIYKAKAITLHQAKDSGIVDADFECDIQCKEGWSVGYAEHEGTTYLVIDYEAGGRYVKFQKIEYVKATVFAFDESGWPLGFAAEA